MPSPREIRVLGVEAPGQAYIWSYEEAPPAAGEFRVETLFSGLSAGTELTFFKGTNPYLAGGWDARLGAFDAESAPVTYPVRFLGYMEVGRVIVSRADAVREGDLVAMTYGHKTGHTAGPGESAVVLPDELDPLLGIYAAQMGPICANGLLHAAAELRGAEVTELGDGVRDRNVLITGGGVIGLLTGLWARQLGAAAVALVDTTQERLRAAEALGLEPVDDSDGQAWRRVKERWRHGDGDAGADVCFQCRGQAAALATALRSLRPQGAVIDLAFYQGGAPELRLGEEFHHNGLSIRCAQISRAPRGLDRLWPRARLIEETITFLHACGDSVRRHVVTDVVPFDEGPKLLADLAARRRHAIQAVLEVHP